MTLYKISVFSRLGRVSIKALRLYDQRNLLKPAKVDTETGYRYYRLAQLSRLHRILAFKAIGLSLEQIGQLLNENLSAEQMQAMLRLKQTELQQQLIQGKQQLSIVESYLKHLHEEQTMPNYEVLIKTTDVIQVASIRETIPTYTAVGQLFNELMGYLEQQQIPLQGYYASIWHNPEYKEQDVDAEAIFQVPMGVTGNDRIQIYELPALETVAALIHRGSYSNLNQAYGAIIQWIENNNYEIVGPNREVYLKGGQEQNNPDYVTEIQFPVRKS